jgi:hypothetical protein
MNGRFLLVLLSLSLASASSAGAPADRDEAGSLLFFSAAEWRQSTPSRKLALSADFMRIFCIDPAMPPARLADCLDGDGATGAMFDRALACVGRR